MVRFRNGSVIDIDVSMATWPSLELRQGDNGREGRRDLVVIHHNRIAGFIKTLANVAGLKVKITEKRPGE